MAEVHARQGGRMAELKRYRTIVADNVRWEGFEFRPGDIVISTPPKCGTTWTQMLVALLVFDSPELPAPLAKISPWLDMQLADRQDVVDALDRQDHRRFIKTHTPLDGLPYDERATYLCVGRDPRDVALSWAHHMSNMNIETFLAARASAVGLDDLAEFAPPPEAETPEERVQQWIDSGGDDGIMSLVRVLDHLRTFWDRKDEPGVALFHYSDLKADLTGQLRRLAEVLGIDVTDERVAQLAAAATFEAMKQRAPLTAPNADIGLWHSTEGFFHRGETGQWREVFDAELTHRYEERVSQLVDAELADWAHHGWLGAGAVRESGLSSST